MFCSPKQKHSIEHKPQRIALITGITGQDGLYLTAYLLDYPELPFRYVVHGIVRKNSATLGLLERIIKESEGEAHLHFGDVTDS